MSLDEMQDFLINECGISEETIDCMVNINGYNKKTFEDILYWKTGYSDFDQLNDDEEV